MIRKMLFGMLLFSICSCSSFREMHFFSDSTPGTPNYYRLRVSGFSLFSSSRYLSGYYDPSAVNQYFNEIRQPEKALINVNEFSQGQNANTLPDSLKASKQPGGSYTSTVAGKDIERLVLIYSTNSDAVSNQIGLITENEATMDALAYLLYDDRNNDWDAKQIQHSVHAKRNKLLIDLGDPLVANLAPTDPKSKVYSSLLQYLNTLALELGNTTPFSNFDEAKSWLDRNRSGIINSTK